MEEFRTILKLAPKKEYLGEINRRQLDMCFLKEVTFEKQD